MNSKEILELLKYGERVTLECKDSHNEIRVEGAVEFSHALKLSIF